MSAPRSSRKERERRQHREAILAAALGLFGEHGLHGVSMQQIAEKAEFATGTLYNFFQSKEALFQELLLRCARRIEEQLTPILRLHAPPDMRLRELIRAHNAVIRDNLPEIRLFYKVFQAEARHTLEPDLLVGDTRAVFDRLQTECAGVIDEGVAAGLFAPMDAQIVTMGLDAMLEAVAFRAAATQQLDQVDRWLAEIERLFFNGVLVRGGGDAIA